MAIPVLDESALNAATSRVTMVMPATERPPAAQLLCVAGAEVGRAFRVGAAPVVIGRGEVGIVLSSHDVSRSHARLSLQDREFVIEDLGSANGTYVNSAPVTGRTALRIGDRIQIGSTIFMFAHFDELEEQMRMLQRIEAIGTFAAHCAHDLKNALTVIIMNLDAFDGLAMSNEVGVLVNEIRVASSSASRIAHQLMQVGRNDQSPGEIIELAPVVDCAATVLRRKGGGVSIVSSVAKQLAVLGSFDDLYQILLNLFLNARDAMPEGGTVSVDAAAVELDTAQALARRLPSAGEYVELEISDTGVGMDEATLARAFEPYFTTKAKGQGTGLGLALLHASVRRCGGVVRVESAPQGGTTFRILLRNGSSGKPQRVRTMEDEPATSPSTADTGPSERIVAPLEDPAHHMTSMNEP